MSDEKPQDASEGGIGQSASTAGLGAWLPIETAPKDGTWIILAGGICDGDESDNNRLVTAQWTNYLNGSESPNYERWQFAWYDGGYYGTYDSPTYWMPLPEAPNVELTGAGTASG